MKKEKKQSKKEEKCPLCKVSEDTLKRLKSSGNKKIEDKAAKNNEKSRNRK